MTQRKFDTLQDNQAIVARRGLIGTVPPTVALLVTEEFANTPPPASLIVTEEFANAPPTASLLTTEEFNNTPPIAQALVTDEFDGYAVNPNVIIRCVEEGTNNSVIIPAAIGLQQDNGAGAFIDIPPFAEGYIEKRLYPERDHKALPSNAVDVGGVIYDRISAAEVIFTPSYGTLTTITAVYRRRAD